MSSAVAVLPLGLSSLGAAAAWVVAFRAWWAVRPQIPSGPEGREARGRLITMMILPTTLVLFGLVILLLMLGERVSDAQALPAGLSSGVPGLLSGVGMAMTYRRAISAAATSKQMFGRALPLVTTADTAAIFGTLVSVLLVGGGSHPTATSIAGLDSAWMATVFSMAGGVSAPLGAWFAVSSWDFKTEKLWPRALTRSGNSGYVSVAFFALSMVVLGQWLIVLLLVLLIGVALALGLALLFRARRKGQKVTNPP